MKQFKQHCCLKRSILEKILLVVVVLLLCLLIALFSVFVFHLQNGSHSRTPKFKPFATPEALVQKNRSICMTPECVQAASQIIDFIDTSVDPCEDFYSFVCGNFLNKSRQTNELTPLSKFESRTVQLIDALITEPVPGPIPKSWAAQRQFYKTCMDVDAIEKDNGYTFSTLIEKLGDWPVLKGRFWKEENFNWISSIINCRQLGFSYNHFMSISAYVGPNTTETVLLSISPPPVTQLPFEFRSLYIDIMANISIDMGAPTYLAKNEFIRVHKFEEDLRNLAHDEIQNGNEVIISVSKLQENYPFVHWKYFLNKIAQGPLGFADTSLIRFSAGRYLTGLQRLLNKTPKSVQANYVIWKLIENFQAYLKESVRGRYESFLSTLSPDYAFIHSRHIHCLNKAKEYFPSVAELAYVRKYLQPTKRNDIKKITTQIKSQLMNKVKDSNWLDTYSKKISLNRLENVAEHIGSSDESYIGDFDKVLDLEELNLPSNILEMVLILNNKHADDYFKIVNKHVKDVTKETLSYVPVLSVNAFYNEDFNTLIVPVPLLQGVMYDFQRPHYMNYGALGSVIGHEFTHAFVANKNVTQEGYNRWSKHSIAKYEEKIQCLLDDYQRYNKHLREFTKNSKAALEENIADLLGPQLSYRAYQQRVNENGQEPILPSLGYTQNQIFWIMSSIYHCYQPKLQGNVRFDQNHAVPSYSVTSSIRNSVEFASDFNCPRGSNMNPDKKCNLL